MHQGEIKKLKLIESFKQKKAFVGWHLQKGKQGFLKKKNNSFKKKSIPVFETKNFLLVKKSETLVLILSTK